MTRIAVRGNGGGRVYDGVGAVLGGGGNARYLMDYPARQRRQILRQSFRVPGSAPLGVARLHRQFGNHRSRWL